MAKEQRRTSHILLCKVPTYVVPTSLAVKHIILMECQQHEQDRLNLNSTEPLDTTHGPNPRNKTRKSLHFNKLTILINKNYIL